MLDASCRSEEDADNINVVVVVVVADENKDLDDNWQLDLHWRTNNGTNADTVLLGFVVNDRLSFPHLAQPNFRGSCQVFANYHFSPSLINRIMHSFVHSHQCEVFIMSRWTIEEYRESRRYSCVGSASSISRCLPVCFLGCWPQIIALS